MKVHYKAFGRPRVSFSFECYRRLYKERRRFSGTPVPTTTDLREVTCPACWDGVVALVPVPNRPVEWPRPDLLAEVARLRALVDSAQVCECGHVSQAHEVDGACRAFRCQCPSFLAAPAPLPVEE